MSPYLRVVQLPSMGWLLIKWNESYFCIIVRDKWGIILLDILIPLLDSGPKVWLYVTYLPSTLPSTPPRLAVYKYPAGSTYANGAR